MGDIDKGAGGRLTLSPTTSIQLLGDPIGRAQLIEALMQLYGCDARLIDIFMEARKCASS